jgi:hypothetical protein
MMDMIDVATKEEWVGRCYNAEERLAKALARIAELTEALKLADGVLSGANMNRAVVERKVRAALGDKT